AVPSAITKNSYAVSPWVMRALPSRTSTSSVQLATSRSSRFDSDANSGIDFRRASSMRGLPSDAGEATLSGSPTPSQALRNPDPSSRAGAVGERRVVHDSSAEHARPAHANALAVDGLPRRGGVGQQRARDGVELAVPA